jgi:glycosyltransferase involved in cell wall biosynthesis
MIVISYFLFFSILLVFFYIGWWKHIHRNSPSKETFDASKISVVIPFRNESSNIVMLRKSIVQLKIQALEYIWVNDHSEDDSLVQFENAPENHKVISLDKTEFGKKSAIRRGIEQAKAEYILTWDADITVPASYFEQLQTTPIADLLILPVAMVGKGLMEIFYELDYYFLNSINIAVSSFTKPIVASGANLIFNKAIFQSLDSYSQHKNIASGDDQFLLNDFKRANKHIQINTCHNLTVQTETPHHIKSFMQQRLRWIGKSSHIKDLTTSIISLIGLAYVTPFIYLLFTPNWFFVLVLKIVLDTLILLPYLHCLRRKKITWNTPFFTFIYPFYFFVIVVLSLCLKTQWKGRSVDSF